MKIKHLEKSANVAWSPKSHPDLLLSVGTAAQQLDSSFSTNAALELYSLNLREPGPDLLLKGSCRSDHRFYKIAWSDHNGGTIIGGCDGGILQVYNSSKILKGEEGLVGSQNKHTGPVNAIDVNPFQQNLFATGAADSEIYIWDLNNVATPMSPGVRTQPAEDVLSVAWNKQVQHILSSVFTSKCVIWDLRKNEPIIKLSDTVSRIRWKQVAWHPEVATQLCLASEEDHSPVIQLWDLRFATSPLKSLEHHQRGVLSVAWCQDDSDLLISTGKDNMILCWNPNSSHPMDELTEIAQTNQWIFDIAWCPRNPAIIACPCFDGHVSVYSLMGGKTQQVQTSSKIADSFPGMDGYVQAPAPQQAGPSSKDLIKPPKWLKRPVGASFGFGGKLISFEHDKRVAVENQQNSQTGLPVLPVQRTVQISQVVTDPDLVQHSNALEEALQSGQFKDYCSQKADRSNDPHKQYIWNFLKANFAENPRAELLTLLGYKIEDVNSKLNRITGVKNKVDNLVDQLSELNRIEDYDNNVDVFDSISQKPPTIFKIKTGDDTEGLITQALILGNVEAAVELCLKAKRYADALIIAMTGGTDLLARTQHKYLEQNEGYVSSLISALISEDWSAIINSCDMASWKEALAATLTHCSDEELPILCEQLGSRLEEESVGNPRLAEDAQLCYICAGSFDRLVRSWITKTTTSSKDIQELVEFVSFLQKSVERQGRRVEISGALADLLAEYSSLLADQGSLSSALNYIPYSGPTVSEDSKVVALRHRLQTSLMKKPAVVNPSRRDSNQYIGAGSKYMANQPQAAFQGQPAVANSFNYNNFNAGLPNSGVVSGGYNQPPPPRTFSPPAVPLSQPPRPSSVSSNHGTSGLPSRKYVLDPSVSSSPFGHSPYASLSANPPLPPSSGFHQQAYQPPATYQQPNIPFQTAHSSLQPPRVSAGSGFPPPSSAHPPPIASFPLTPPISSMAPPSFPQGPSARLSGRGSRTTSFSESDNAMPSGYNKPDQGQNVLNYAHNAPPGWNDPPTAAFNKPKPKSDPFSQEPITHPIFGSAPSQATPGPANPDPGYYSGSNQQYYNSAPPPPTIYSQDNAFSNNNHQFPTSYDPKNFNQNMGGFNQSVAGFNQMGNAPDLVQAAAPPQPVVKAPIPEEHIHMKTVFDTLREQCSCTSNNPQTKRKLEDVAKKLETLYDLLRENSLSPNTLENLHELVALVQQGNYSGALQHYTQLASGPDFSQIASFMPGIKILISCALQLQVYIS